MDEVFGEHNFCGQISFRTTGGQSNSLLASSFDILLWYARNRDRVKYRALYLDKPQGSEGSGQYTLMQPPDGVSPPMQMTATQRDGNEPIPSGFSVLAHDTLYSSGAPSDPKEREFVYQGRVLTCPPNNHWKPGGRGEGMKRLAKANRFLLLGNTLRYRRYWNDFRVKDLENLWVDTGRSGFADKKKYIVETAPRVVERCILMTTDPGDLVFDPTCGSGTTAYVAEQWGRRWITVDTSRVSLALARSRIMGARYPYYILYDSEQGQKKEAEVTRSVPKTISTHSDVRLGFVYERVPHIMLKDIANNSEIDTIWEKWQSILEPIQLALNEATQQTFLEWEIPLEPKNDWSSNTKKIHLKWLDAKISRQKEIDASIASRAEFEFLYDKPYIDNTRIRVAGPFTVESLSPHRTLAVGSDDELIDTLQISESKHRANERDANIRDFSQMIIENLRAAGVQQVHKDSRINFSSLSGWPGHFICAEGLYLEGEQKRRAGIFIGPEFGTVSRPDLVAAAREAGDAGFDVLIACAFNYDAHSSEFDKLGRVPVLKARMNPDLLMAKDLKTTGTGNLFVVFGEPDIQIEHAADNMIRVKVFGVDVFKPQTGAIVSEGTDGIALWMLDTDYNEESFFVRHAYFLGANDPYKALKTNLKAEIDEAAWESLYSDVSRPFPKPKSGRIAVKVINHLGDEVMKVFGV